MFFFSSFGYGGYDYNPWAGRREKSDAALQRERYAKKEFDKIVARFERSKIAINELIIRNACKQESCPWSSLSDLDIVRIFQYARPKDYNSLRQEEQALLKSKKKTKPRKYEAWQFRRSEYLEQQNKAKMEDKVKDANEKELAEAAGSLTAGPPLPRPTTLAAAPFASGATGNAGGGTMSTASGRKGKKSAVNYNESIGDKEFEAQLKAYDKQKPKAPAKGFASLEAAKKGGGEEDNSEEDEVEEDTRSVEEVIDSIYAPGRKLVIHLLDPRTHLTGPSFRDFNRYVKEKQGWMAKRVEATQEERTKFKFKKKGKAYFVNVVHTNPGTLKKVSKTKKKPSSKKRKVGKTGDAGDAVSYDDILAEAKALAEEQNQPAKKKSKID